MNSLKDLISTVHKLRAPGGCPWDRAQTHQSLRPYVIEEAYEVLEVLDQIDSPAALKNEKILADFREELGDLLMQVLLHSEMVSEQNGFDFYDVARGLNEKLIRRHPHVFGDVKADNAAAALQSWEKQKAQEKEGGKEGGKESPSVLSGLPKALPALQRSARLIEKVTHVGFQWKDIQGPLEKIDEELCELKREIEKKDKVKMEEELGDLLFSLCNLASLLKLNPENALRGTLSRFEKRFRYVESKLREQGKKPEQSTLEEMDALWNEAKKQEI